MLVLLVVSSVFVSCDKDNDRKNININSKHVQQRRGWGAVAADVFGLADGITLGFAIGKHFGPNGAVIGSMLGGVTRCVYESYTYGCRSGLLVTYSDTEIPMAPFNTNSTNNPYDYIGIIHNKLLNKYLTLYGGLSAKTQLDKEVLNIMINDVLAELSESGWTSTLNSFNFEEFKHAFVNNNTSLIANQSILDIMDDFKKQGINDTSELENFISTKFTNNMSKEELMGIAILRYSFYYWQ